MQSFDECSREEIIKSFTATITVPPDHVVDMKSTLNLPWYLLTDVRRWLKTFKINLASERKSRSVVKQWVGGALHSEEIPALILKGEKILVELRPWCYIINLVGYVLHYLDNLKAMNKLI